MLALVRPLLLSTTIFLALSLTASGAEPAGSGRPGAFGPAKCEGVYRGHLQGICTNQRDAIYWSFTDVLVKTDVQGHLLKKVTVASHHGDLCFEQGRVYVAVNLGKFNQPEGKADSWVYVYDADDLRELARHKTAEVVHGAGGIGCRDGRFLIVGGLPPSVEENYLYEYDASFHFQKRHVLASGYTFLGIQTAAFAADHWWLGCYGTPAVLLKADSSFRMIGKYEISAAYGIVGLPDGRLLVARNTSNRAQGSTGSVVLAEADAKAGLRILTPASEPIPMSHP